MTAKARLPTLRQRWFYTFATLVCHLQSSSDHLKPAGESQGASLQVKDFLQSRIYFILASSFLYHNSTLLLASNLLLSISLSFLAIEHLFVYLHPPRKTLPLPLSYDPLHLSAPPSLCMVCCSTGSRTGTAALCFDRGCMPSCSHCHTQNRLFYHCWG